MVENLLHATVALSRAQLTQLAEQGITGESSCLGTMTYLGADQLGNTVYFLLRFERGVYGTPVTPMAIEKVFGENFFPLIGDAKGMKSSDVRVLITMHLRSAIRNPYGFLHAQCDRFAKALVQTHVELERDDVDDGLYHQFIEDEELPLPTTNDLYEAGLLPDRTDR